MALAFASLVTLDTHATRSARHDRIWLPRLGIYGNHGVKYGTRARSEAQRAAYEALMGHAPPNHHSWQFDYSNRSKHGRQLFAEFADKGATCARRGCTTRDAFT